MGGLEARACISTKIISEHLCGSGGVVGTVIIGVAGRLGQVVANCPHPSQSGA